MYRDYSKKQKKLQRAAVAVQVIARLRQPTITVRKSKVVKSKTRLPTPSRCHRDQHGEPAMIGATQRASLVSIRRAIRSPSIFHVVEDEAVGPPMSPLARLRGCPPRSVRLGDITGYERKASSYQQETLSRTSLRSYLDDERDFFTTP